MDSLFKKCIMSVGLLVGALFFMFPQQATAQSASNLNGCDQGAYPLSVQSIWGVHPVTMWYSPRCNARYISVDLRNLIMPPSRTPRQVRIYNPWAPGSQTTMYFWQGPQIYYGPLMVNNPGSS